MRNSRPWTVVLLVIVLAAGGISQELSHDFRGTKKLYEIQAQLMAGDKNALFKLAAYFDSDKQVVDFLGYHRIETTEADVAKRMVEENCSFTEIAVSKTTTKEEFEKFLSNNSQRIVFSKEVGLHLVMPLAERSVEFEALEITANRKAELKNRLPDLMKLDWVEQSGIRQLIEKRDSRVLQEIAFHLLKNRSRWNKYYHDEQDDLDLLQHLTATKLVVKNEKGEFSHHIEGDYYPESKLNLAIFFAKNHPSYTYDANKDIFVNPNIKSKALAPERVLFEELKSKDTDAAFRAYARITELNPELVVQLTSEYQDARVPINSALPTFEYRFLRQLSVLTDYCRKNGVDFSGGERMRLIVEGLKEDLPLSSRYKKENELIEQLTLDELTAFEYWALIHEKEDRSAYSAGRILDKAYSRHWKQLVGSDKELNLYLKKSSLFDALGIRGAVNNYLEKFADASPSLRLRLKRLKPSDGEVTSQLEKALVKKSQAISKPGAMKYGISLDDLEARLKDLASVIKPTRIEEDDEEDGDESTQDEAEQQQREKEEEEQEELEANLYKTLAELSYDQIGPAMKYLEGIGLGNSSIEDSKYDFLDLDWGLELVGDWDDEQVRRDFLTNYSSLSQRELYIHYLEKSGFDFRRANGTLDFDKIYNMLKYDLVVPLTGAGTIRDANIYPLIKLLEINFATTLGFPDKLCVEGGRSGCSTFRRSRTWMKYLVEKKHLRRAPDEPGSFNFKGEH